MIVEHTQEKLQNAVIYFLKHTKYCGKTKLVKLLYYLDFYHFKEIGASVTGLEYKAYEFGPYPEAFGIAFDRKEPAILEYLSIENTERFTKIQPLKKFDRKYFSKREIRILEKVAYIFRDAKAQDIVETTHLKNEPWHTTLQEKGMRQVIDYFLALENDSPPKEQIIEDRKDREQFRRLIDSEG